MMNSLEKIRARKNSFGRAWLLAVTKATFLWVTASNGDSVSVKDLIGIFAQGEPPSASALLDITDPNRPAVLAIYQQILQRPPDPNTLHWCLVRFGHDGEKAKNYIRTLAHTREYIVNFVTGKSPEYIIDRIFECTLARKPNAEEYSREVAPYQKFALNSIINWAPANLIDRCLDSPEYQSRFGDNGIPGYPGVHIYGPASDLNLDTRSALLKKSFNIRQSPAKPGEKRYFVGFEGQPADFPNLRPGHAFVFWETQLPDGTTIELKGWGIYGQAADDASSSRLAKAFTTQDSNGRSEIFDPPSEETAKLYGPTVFPVED